jgi:TolB-like protein/tetratricopeptide (TPR) repeat protein
MTRRRTIAVAVLTVVVFVTVAVALGRGGGDASGVADLRSIAVMPFAIQGARADQDVTFFADGVHSDLLTQLSKIDSLTVVSRTSVVSLGESDLSVAEVAERLGVATVLTGSIQRAGQRIRVNVQLIDTGKGDHLWAETYDEDFTIENIFAIQSDMAREIARALRMTLTPEVERQLVARPTGTLEAYDHYVRGRYVASNRRTREGLEDAVALFRKAIEADTGYAMAYTGLADAYFQLWHLGYLSPEQTLPQARAAVERALALDELLAEAHLSLGNMLRAELRFDEAEEEFQRALALNPGLAEVHKEYAHLLLERGRFDEAVPAARRAVEIDPLSLPNRLRLVGILLFTRRYDEGITEGWRLLELEPDNQVAYYYLGALYAMQGRYPEAIDALERSIELDPGFKFNFASLAWVYARSGQRDLALETLRHVSEQGSLLKEIALVHAELGDMDRAFEYLERAYEEDPGSLSFLNADPQSDLLRSDPRFEDLLGRLGIGPS